MKKIAIVVMAEVHQNCLVDIVGGGLTGAEELYQLEAAGIRTDQLVRQMLTSTLPDSFDARHRLGKGTYKIVLFPAGNYKSRESVRTAGTYLKLINRQRPPAGIMPPFCREARKRMELVRGFDFIVAPHLEIMDSGGGSRTLVLVREKNEFWLRGFSCEDRRSLSR